MDYDENSAIGYLVVILLVTLFQLILETVILQLQPVCQRLELLHTLLCLLKLCLKLLFKLLGPLLELLKLFFCLLRLLSEKA